MAVSHADTRRSAYVAMQAFGDICLGEGGARYECAAVVGPLMSSVALPLAGLANLHHTPVVRDSTLLERDRSSSYNRPAAVKGLTSVMFDNGDV